MPCTYLISQVHRLLHETLTAPPISQVTLSRTHYVVHVDGTIHRVRRDRVCDCGRTPESHCPAIPLVQDYLAAGGEKPIGRHSDTWPESWIRIPPSCPVCDCPTIPDRCLNSRAGPGGRCSIAGCQHFWQVRMEPRRRYLIASPPEPRYPWGNCTSEERRAWLEAHYHQPRLQSPKGGFAATASREMAPSTEEGENRHALDRTPPCQGQPCPWLEIPWLEAIWPQRGSLGLYDRLLRSRELGRDR